MADQKALFLRGYEPGNAGRVVEVINANAARTVGFGRAVVDGVGHVRLAEYLKPSGEKVVAINPEGEIAGFAYHDDVDQHVISEVGGAVHPDYWEQGVGTMLVGWAEEQARALAERAPKDIRAVLQVNLYEVEKRAIRLFTGLGFVKVREWAHLVIELDAEPTKPTLPDDLSIRPMDLGNDWGLVDPAIEEAFANHWGVIEGSIIKAEEEQDVVEAEDESYSNSPGYCFIALAEGVVVGGVLCNVKLVERLDTGRVGSLFVRPGYRRRGIGRALMLKAFDAFWRSGVRRIVTDTDAESFTEAPKLYGSLGMRLYRREFLYEKEMRPGRETRIMDNDLTAKQSLG